MPAPVPYNGSQSRLEYYALHGNVSVNKGLGRPDLTQNANNGLLYPNPFQNPTITNNPADQYNVTHPNAVSTDGKTPFRGKGTNQPMDLKDTYNGIVARYNYAGGDDYDIKGGFGDIGKSAGFYGVGRKKSLTDNLGTWGYAPTDASGVANMNNWYKLPNMTANVGQVTI